METLDTSCRRATRRARGPTLQDSVNEELTVPSFPMVSDPERELLVLIEGEAGLLGKASKLCLPSNLSFAHLPTGRSWAAAWTGTMNTEAASEGDV